MILILQQVPHEPPGPIGEALSEFGLRWKVHRLYKRDRLPKEPGDAHGLIVLGGPMGVDDEAEHPFLRPEKKLIEAFVDARRPVLGICLGSQLLAEVLGAVIVRAPAHELGWLPVEWTPEARRHPHFAHFPETQTVFQWHGDTFDLPIGAVRLAASELCANQAFAFGPYVVGLQFHLEVTEESIHALLNHKGHREMLAALPEPLDPDEQRALTDTHLSPLHDSCRQLVKNLFAPKF